jgi:adenylate cyclase
MLSITVTNKKQRQQYEHAGGPLELGRGPQQPGSARLQIQDIYVSRNQLRLEQRANDQVEIENISQSRRVRADDGGALNVGERRTWPLPVRLRVGETVVSIESSVSAGGGPLHTIAEPFQSRVADLDRPNLLALGESPAPLQVAEWMERVIALLQQTVDGAEFYDNTARALVELIGLDQGLVLLQSGDAWDIAALFGGAPGDAARFSRRLVGQVVAERRTFYQDPARVLHPTQSLVAGEAVVVSPVFGLRGEVRGVLYGLRRDSPPGAGRIRPLEAQVVQLLAGATGAHLARSAALRTRVQFEQFFSPELARELERDPHLLEARSQEVTVLMSDLRGFTTLSERLGPDVTCGLIRDLLERLSARVAEFGGVIVDYAGDGMLAMWNAPVPQPDHAARACLAALAMGDEMPGVNERWRQKAGEPLRLGVGVNTGPALVGNMGSTRKFKYGPHGHTVNVASRVQAATCEFPEASVLVTETTRQRLGDHFALRRCPPVSLKGVKEGMVLYELCGELISKV